MKNSKIHFFELRNPVGWVPHAVLALNQWIRPKNRGSKKSVPQTYKNVAAWYLKSTKLVFVANSPIHGGNRKPNNGRHEKAPAIPLSILFAHSRQGIHELAR